MEPRAPEQGTEEFDAAVRRFANRMLGSSTRQQTTDLTSAFFGEALIRGVESDGALMAHIAAVALLAKRLGESPAVVAAAVSHLIRCAAGGPANDQR